MRELCERVGLPLDPDARAERLSVGLKQRLEIVKALAADARVLLLDEPTAVLAPGEIGELLRMVRRFTVTGGSAVLITHKLDEALDGADRVTVLRRGEVVGTGAVAAWSVAGLTQAMIGSVAARPTGHRRVDRRMTAGVRLARGAFWFGRRGWRSHASAAAGSLCGMPRWWCARGRSSGWRRWRETGSGSCCGR